MNALPQATVGLLIYVAVFVGALIAFEGFRQVLSRTEDPHQARNRRMRARAKGAKTADLQQQLLERNAVIGKQSLLGRFHAILGQAGWVISPVRFVTGQLGLAILVFLAASQAFAMPVAALLGVVVGFALPMLFVLASRAQRLEKITAQLPDALDLMARGLTVGHPLSVTVGNVANDMPDPIGSEFGLIQDQVQFGDDITEAFAAFAQRVGTEDARYASVSVGIQHGTGGNLAHVLGVLAKVIRDRATMRKKIRAISAEGRLSAFILSILPFGIFGIINITAPTFYAQVWDDPMFKYFAIAVLVLVALQILILFRMVNFKF
ncbi:hypothetical protein ACMU_14360 [Actibacterium mucosum KCTC 23349]|uniref:Type II secretion system protein GspF domain-containing protein n=1 Tax=Actibacterium mucosum KCTC 23349 TaxID=1454373 RepID=A0A037ZJH0_9RHOB|nr:type II secretion system F family protein [Actibacterium mucosum]KAJ54941.1 hypothetical protein ACMU_14360 [Actibacterium mucosum KCTC 23349]